jgi:hypothetical protein
VKIYLAGMPGGGLKGRKNMTKIPFLKILISYFQFIDGLWDHKQDTLFLLEKSK